MVDPARAVFLDRDGVINRAFIRAGKSFPPDRLEDFEILPGVAEACARLKQAGYRLIVVTNQPDVASGKQTRAVVESMHAAMTAALPIDAVFTCYHRDEDACACRKPKPGMLLAAAQRFGLDLANCHLVGDRSRDILAGQSAGCRCFFIDYQYQETGPEGAYETVSGLLDAADRICTPARHQE
jgi:D-glycero-D-manno-heptose 1,7-bisphosphate phosphatase